MNWDMLHVSGVVRLRPKAIRQFPDGQCREVDEDWKIESADKKQGVVNLRNLRSATPVRLFADHIKNWTSDPTCDQSEKRGFLILVVRVHISSSNGFSIEPLTVIDLAGGGAASPKSPPPVVLADAWDAIISRYSARPKFWEQSLTCDLVEDALQGASRRLKELNEGLVYRRVEFVHENRVIDKVRDLFAEMMSVADQLDPALKQLVPAWGPDGVPGRPEEIRRACCRLRDLIDALVEWEVEVHFIRPADEKYERLFLTLKGTVHGVLRELNRIPIELRSTIEKAGKTPGPHMCDLQLKFDAPSNLAEFKREMKRLQGGLFS